MENQRPFSNSFLHFPAQSLTVLTPKQSALGVQLDIANQLLIPEPDGGVVEEDFETQRLKVEWRRGLKNDLELGISSQLIARNGGILDGFLKSYHKLIGYDAAEQDNPQGRDSRPKGRSVFRFEDADGQGIDVGSEFGLGDTTFSLKKQLSTGKFASAARLAVKAPTGSGSKVLGSGGWDAGIGFDARYEFSKKWSLFGNVAALKFGGSDIPNADSSGWQGGLGLEWATNKRDSIVAQFDAQSSIVKTGNSLADEMPVLASLGYKRRINPNQSLWASFSENGDWVDYRRKPLGHIGPDFTLSFGYEWRR